MGKTIDCLLIGHNEMDFAEYERHVRKMGSSSGAYRDLTKSFIQYDHRLYPVAEMFNLFYGNDNGTKGSPKPLKMGESFSVAIAYLGTYLHRRGLTFDYVNSFADGKEELSEKLRQEEILTIAIATTLYVFAFPIIEIIEFIREYNQTAKIIVGGPFISTQVRTLDSEDLKFLFKTIGADLYVDSAQGEATLVDIIHSLKNGLPLSRLNNIYYKVNGEFLSTPVQIEKNQLSKNMVDWDLFSPAVGEYVNVRTSISCPFSCAFCGFPEHAGKYQVAEVEEIETELNGLARIDALENVYFIDDTFNVPVKRFKEILRMMIRHKYRFNWHSNFRCQYADREMVELMKESNCLGVFLGIESGSDRILENMNKSATVKKYLDGIALLKEYEIATHGNFIIGFPGETTETVKETIQFIEESKMDFYRAQLWYCETITPIWKQREKFDIRGSQFEWSHATMDSKTASGWVDKIFLSVKNSVWVPQYNFDFYHVVHLMQRGLGLERIKVFLKAFNDGLREKIVEPSRKEVSLGVIKQLKRTLAQDDGVDDQAVDEINLVDKYRAEFRWS